jgi:predicted kinase
MNLTLIRGLPGSGKSTLARKMLEPGVLHVESDMYFMDRGRYRFEKHKVARAHRWCLDKVRGALRNGKSCIVSNTFTMVWEMQFFIDLARMYGAGLRVIRCSGDYGSIHGVPDQTLEQMRGQWEPYEGEDCLTTVQESSL